MVFTGVFPPEEMKLISTMHLVMARSLSPTDEHSHAANSCPPLGFTLTVICLSSLQTRPEAKQLSDPLFAELTSDGGLTELT